MTKDLPPVERSASVPQGYSNRYIYLLVIASSAIGYGNVWRFPNLVYENGGAIFILVYIVVLMLIAIPMLLVEVGAGQVLGGNQVYVWSRFGKGCKPMSIGFWVTFTILGYYPVLLSWSSLFLIHSFRDPFKWANDPAWEEECSLLMSNTTCLDNPRCLWNSENADCSLDFVYGSKKFFKDYVYVDSTFVDPLKMTHFSYEVFAALIFAWICVYLCCYAGPRIMGLTQIATMGLPVIMLFVLLIISFTFEGARTGVEAYITKFTLKKSFPVTIIDAVSQSIFSLTIGQGVMTTLSSANDKNQNFFANVLCMTIADTFFALISGFCIFAFAGFLAVKSNVTIENLGLKGITLVFTTYPAALAQLRAGFAQVIAVLFFLMLWLLGFSTVCTLAEALINPIVTSRFGKRLGVKQGVATALVALFFVVVYGSFMSTDLGHGFLDRIDEFNSIAQTAYAATYIVSLSWIFASGLSMKYTGKTAYLCHAITFLSAPVILGIISTWYWPVGVALGIIIPVAGYIAALYLYKPREDGSPVPIKEKAYYLGIYNAEKVRYLLNGPLVSWPRIPKAWSFLVKYIIPYVAFYLCTMKLFDRGVILDQPSATNRWPFYVFIVSAISPICMWLCILFLFKWPAAMDFLLPPDFEGPFSPSEIEALNPEGEDKNVADSLVYKSLLKAKVDVA